MASEYRKEATDGSYYSDLIDYGYDDNKTILIDEVTVTKIVNIIESDINEIANILDDIKGLTEIDEAKEKLRELSMKLY